MPNLILAGPPGCGKTTSIMCLAHALLGAKYKEAVLELNASDERGLDVVRSKIKMFAQTKVGGLPPGRHKIIILDEADSMTPAAQQALRRTMELHSSSTRFALACNMSSKVIEPIQSRCAIVRYSTLSNAQLGSRLVDIAQKEGVIYTDDGIEALVFTADGDMRQAINNLQATYSGFGIVRQEDVFKVCDQPHPLLVRQIILACSNADLGKAQPILRQLWRDGFSPLDLITAMFRVTRGMGDLQEFVKLEYIREIGFCHLRIAENVASEVQLTGLLAKLCQTSIKAAAP